VTDDQPTLGASTSPDYREVLALMHAAGRALHPEAPELDPSDPASLERQMAAVDRADREAGA
jgi:hypothetical protein